MRRGEGQGEDGRWEKEKGKEGETGEMGKEKLNGRWEKEEKERWEMGDGERDIRRKREKGGKEKENRRREMEEKDRWEMEEDWEQREKERSGIMEDLSSDHMMG